jgi:5-methyltetrahydropteroyltriglutamate--homocysteine methyltransferase
MTAGTTTHPPFRADHVGSLLRPDAIKDGRERLLGPQSPDANLGPHHNAELAAIEDRCICDVIAMQERVGLQPVTDGEFRRRSFLLESILSWQGLDADRTGNTEWGWKATDGTPTQATTRIIVKDKIRWRESAAVKAFTFLREHTRRTPKVTLASPALIIANMGPEATDGRIYRESAELRADLLAAYRQEIAALAAAGATYVQIDDTAIAFMCDPVYRERMSARFNTTPDAVVRLYAELINGALSEVPQGVTVVLHQCRGNREGQWGAQGAYDPVAEVLFNEIDVSGYLLEYDTARAGGFEPLRLLPRDKTAVLGLVSTKTPQLESADELLRRIDEAGTFAPLEQLGISPQCGFASSIKGNPLTESEQEAKLARVVEVAQRVWG